MKALLLVLGGSLLWLPPHAYGLARISLYSDVAFTDCTLSDTSPGVVSVYVVEWTDFCGTGLRFRVAESAGFTGVWLSETSPYFPIGSSRTDLSLGFGQALEGRFLVLTMSYQLFGTSSCSQLSIAPAVGFPVPICTYCFFGEWPCAGFDPLYVNCSGPVNCSPVATESTTWGKVKALYRN